MQTVTVHPSTAVICSDAFTATAHFQVGPLSREIQGRVLLEQQADTTML